MRKSLKFAAIFLPASLLAGACGVAAFSTVLAERIPERAVALPIVDGNAYSELALERVDAKRTDNGSLDIQTLAARAFRSEPTNSGAISTLALMRQVAGHDAAARTIYADALLLSPRDKVANLALIEDASNRGQIGLILQRYDALLRTGGVTSDALLDVLLTALRERAALPHIEAILTDDPPWAKAFWIKAAVNDPAIANVGLLRLGILRDGKGNPAGNDPDIVSRLVGAGEYATAFAIYRSVSKEKRRGVDLLANAGFDKAPTFPPFDWATYSDARYGAEVDADSGMLIVFAESPVDNLVARQLVALPGGTYSVEATVRDPQETKGTTLTLRIRCANPGAERADRIASTRIGVRSAAVDFPGGCEFVWIELWARKDTPASVYATDVAIDSITVRRRGRAGAAANVAK